VQGLFAVGASVSAGALTNAPVVGQLMTELIDQVENGVDHDASPVPFRAPHTGLGIDLGTFSRKRNRNTANSGTVLG